MPSPFPGMDPYIEQMGDWVGFHNTFIVHCSELLNEVLPEQYVATTEARIRFQESNDVDRAMRSRRPDVSVTHRAEPAAIVSAGGTATTMQPVTLPQEDLWANEVHEAFIEIVRVPGEELVTTIELLSPSNKACGSPDRATYLAKRRQLLHDGVNVVDIDLLLAGERLPMLEPLPAGDYFAFVSRAVARTHCDVYAWSVRQPLPIIPIPLLPADAPAPLDLATAFRTTYDRGRYRRLVRYDVPAPQPLATPDRAWAADLARTAVAR